MADQKSHEKSQLVKIVKDTSDYLQFDIHTCPSTVVRITYRVGTKSSGYCTYQNVKAYLREAIKDPRHDLEGMEGCYFEVKKVENKMEINIRSEYDLDGVIIRISEKNWVNRLKTMLSLLKAAHPLRKK